MKLNTILIFLYLSISFPLFLFFKADFDLWISFFLNYTIITVITYYHLKIEKTFSPFISCYIVFTFLFFLVAPIIQIASFKNSESLFPNNYPFVKGDVIFANFLILLFNIFFFLSYVLFKKIKSSVSEVKKKSPLQPFIILCLFTLSLILIVVNFDFIVSEINRANWMDSGLSVPSLLIKKKTLFFIPLGAVVVTYSYLKSKNKIDSNKIIIGIALLFLLIFLLILKNPLIEKRNALGPIYISLIYLFFPKIINRNSKMFLFMFLSLVVFFPLISILTHINVSIDEIVKKPKLLFVHFNNEGLFSVFNSLHYDAYANILATIDYVQLKGYSFGYQLLSAFLFFVPRSLWTSKPLSTGLLVGNHLIDEHGFVYNNLSNPLVSEGYINFGLFGVVIMAIALSFFIIKFSKWLRLSEDPLKKFIAFYFAVHLIFLLRGDFTNGFAYFIGPLIGVVILPKLISRVFNFCFLKRRWKS